MTADARADAVIAAEQAVTGAALRSAEAAGELGGIMRPGWFLRPAHGLIFGAALTLAERGAPVDPVAVMLELSRTGDLRAAGEASYLHECFAAAPADARWHARQAAEEYRRRNALEALSRAVQVLESPGCEPADLEAARTLAADALTPPSDDALRSMSELVTDVVDGLERQEQRGLSTGIRDLDDALGGLSPGQLVLIAARPGVGKSVLLLGIAAHVAMSLGRPVLLSSLEMRAEDMTLRLLSSHGRVNLSSLVRRQLSGDGWDKVASAASMIGDIPLAIDDAPGVSLSHIRSRLRDMDRSSPAALLAVDYLQLMDAPKAENRQVAVSELAWGLRQVAREREIPVLVATQLNRGPENRSDKRPLLSDLRESGALEMHADVVILLHREDAYNRESPRAGEIDLDLAKNRQGPLCTITAAFQGHYSRIVDMAPAWAGTAEVA